MRHIITILALVLGLGSAAQAQTSPRKLRFNNTRLTATGTAQLRSLEAHYRTRLPAGRYWYDRVSGAFGRWGGPPLGFLPPNLALGGRLPRNASASTLPVTINGRAIHRTEYIWFTRLFGRRPQPGHYWLDSRGNLGKVGQRGSINLLAIARRRSGSNSWSVFQRGIGGSHRNSIGVAGDGKTTCVNTANYTRCY